MANSRSENAPENFLISSSNDISHFSNHLKCQLCMLPKQSFHCAACITTGNFIHSNNPHERFAEKQLNYLNIKSSHKALDTRCSQLLHNRIIAENLSTQIKRKKERIFYLHRLLEERRAKLKVSKEFRSEITKKNGETKNKIPHYEHNVNDLIDFVEKRNEKNEQLDKDRTRLQQELKLRVIHNINLLIKYIFPISETISKSTNVSESSRTPDMVALAEATHTAYVKGKWVLQDSQNERQYIIVAPSLPGNGDYSAYIEWMDKHKDGVPSTGANETLSSTNNAYRISAALTYTAQFVHLLSYYLDVRLPYNVFYADFCKKELSEQIFPRKVARLNANILYLCYTQRVKLNSLCPTHTLENIQRLLSPEYSDLGRIGAVDVSDGFRDIDSQLLQDLLTGGDDKSDDENSFQNEWEAIQHYPQLESSIIPLQIQNSQQITSMAGGIMNNAVASVSSLWRWTTGR
ncbi:beclin 1-associated autophagy-related key regulator [Bradysia coprophila]|uniref:beclin 1-associated autophagy-related key regulator n=1 Tax=Bradysia coprophila TaxID=38358 RepID=UPI00187DB209|nr:beclin 1-associated autophagy-related key regulator [Bradysia coprophila]